MAPAVNAPGLPQLDPGFSLSANAVLTRFKERVGIDEVGEYKQEELEEK